MKFIKWKSLVISSLFCLLPILFGLALWNKLPDVMAIHFNINNEADNFASKEFVVFGLPVMMMLLQVICCIINDINAYKHGRRTKFEIATKSIIPVMAIVLQGITIAYVFAPNIDIRRCAVIIVSTIFLVLGNYMPKLDYIKNHDINTDKARKINRFIGFESVIMGVLGLITIFLPPISSIIWLILLIPYVIISIVYGVVIGKK